MRGLANIIYKVLKVADKTTKTLQTDVSYYKYLSSNAAGDTTYESELVLSVIFDSSQKNVATNSGQTILSKCSIIIISSSGLDIKPYDKFCLNGVPIGKIIHVKSVTVSGDSISTTVYFG